MLDRMLASDADFDGRFITGVLSTGIFCLPSCRARKPKPENVRFFGDPESARQAGLRPCKRCRPDLFYKGRDPERERLSQLIADLRREPESCQGVSEMADAAGVGTSKLTESVRRHYQTTPAALLLRFRLQKARRLLLESDHKIADIAFACGFESLSVFNEQFRRSQRMTPSAFRRLRTETSFQLDLPSGYPADFILDYWGRDPQSLSEQVDGETLRVALRLEGRPVVAQAEIGPQKVRCQLLEVADHPSAGKREAASLQAGDGSGPGSTRRGPRGTMAADSGPERGPEDRGLTAHLHQRLLAMLGLDQDPQAFEAAVASDPRLAPLLQRSGLRIPRLAGRVEGLVWVVVGQQVNLPFAFSLRRELYRMAGTPTRCGLVAPPTPRALAEVDIDELRRRRFSQQKAAYLRGLGQALLQGKIPSPRRLYAVGQLEKQLLQLKGLGPWSVRYLLMRLYGCQDSYPLGDAGLVRSLQAFFGLDGRPGPKETQKLMAVFAPYRALAALHLWQWKPEEEKESAA
ncbi:MAG TPA: Ada metal-binding domain-containing protein [Acidobacteriota bacterium]|nr:Ada metal-binding domain-containing protein [Acidobacteriota bacterium]